MSILQFAPGNRAAERAAASDSFLQALLRLRTLRVADVMNRHVIEVNQDQPLAEVARRFLEQQIAAAPVVDGSGCCVGVLSASDILRRDALLQSEPPIPCGVSLPIVPIEEPQSDVANSFMTPAVQSIASEERLLTAAKIMCAQHVHRLFVLDDAARPIGVVSTMDVVAALLHVLDEMDPHEL